MNDFKNLNIDKEEKKLNELNQESSVQEKPIQKQNLNGEDDFNDTNYWKISANLDETDIKKEFNQ